MLLGGEIMLVDSCDCRNGSVHYKQPKPSNLIVGAQQW